MRRYLTPPKRETVIKSYEPVGYVFEFEGKQYTLFADCIDRAQRIFNELCTTGDIHLLKPNT